MAWVKIDDNFPDHPKILRIGLPAIVLQIRALCYASRHLTDGFISSKVEANLLEGFNEWFDDTLVNTNLLADEMVKAGLWEKAEGGYIIHDYLAYNPSKKHVLALRRKRQASGKQGGLSSAQARRKQVARPLLNPRPVPSRPHPQTEIKKQDISSTPPVVDETVPSNHLPSPEQVQEAWNTICSPTLPRMILLNDDRKRKILARCKRLEVLEKWETLFRRMLNQPFLCGQTGKKWRATLDWVIANDTNWARVMEGTYAG